MAKPNINIPQVGTAVLVKNHDGTSINILVGKRISKFGNATWGLPGGKLELNESIIQCAERELLEETGLISTQTKIIDFVEHYNPHWITFFVECIVENDMQPKLLEPDKCEVWKWIPVKKLLDEYKDVLFHPLEIFLDKCFCTLS